MTLLTEIMQRPLDAGYADAAERRRHGTAPRRTLAGTGALLALAGVLGLVGTTAAATLRAPQAEVTSARALLESEVTTRTGEAEALRSARDTLADEVLTLQTDALAGTDEALLDFLETTNNSAGTQAVTGPGMRITLADAAGSGGADGWIQDGDIQYVINGLWEAGAEAIAINNHRLTSLGAVRGAGDAILVGLVPLTGPYVLEAIGDPQHLEPDFARTSAYRYLGMLRTTHGLTAQVAGVSELVLPAASGVTVRYARPSDDGATMSSMSAPQTNPATSVDSSTISTPAVKDAP